jgi:hypothetical protein
MKLFSYIFLLVTLHTSSCSFAGLGLHDLFRRNKNVDPESEQIKINKKAWKKDEKRSLEILDHFGLKEINIKSGVKIETAPDINDKEVEFVFLPIDKKYGKEKVLSIKYSISLDKDRKYIAGLKPKLDDRRNIIISSRYREKPIYAPEVLESHLGKIKLFHCFMLKLFVRSGKEKDQFYNPKMRVSAKYLDHYNNFIRYIKEGELYHLDYVENTTETYDIFKGCLDKHFPLSKFPADFAKNKTECTTE